MMPALTTVASEGLPVHYIWTRFSLRVPQYDGAVRIDEDSREAWFAYRARIFNAGLLACARAQSVRPAGLILLMDTADRPLFERYIEPDDLIRPVYDNHERARYTASDVMKDGAKGTVHVTRVDSDDLISTNFIAAIERALDGHPSQDGMSFGVTTKGYRSDLRFIQSFEFKAAPFITTRFDRAEDHALLRPVGNHKRVLDRAPALCSEGCWMQLLHGSNVANTFLHSVRIRRVSDATWPDLIPRPALDDTLVNNPVSDVRLRAPALERLKTAIRFNLLRSAAGEKLVRALRRRPNQKA